MHTKKLKMRTGASTKPAVKADAPKACIELKIEEDDRKGINPHLLCKPTVNYYRPFAKKVVVVPKLSDNDFKVMEKLHAEKIVAINKAYNLRVAKAAKEAEEKKKLAEAERKKKTQQKMSFDNLTSRQMSKAILALQGRVMQ